MEAGRLHPPPSPLSPRSGRPLGGPKPAMPFSSEDNSAMRGIDTIQSPSATALRVYADDKGELLQAGPAEPGH